MVFVNPIIKHNTRMEVDNKLNKENTKRKRARTSIERYGVHKLKKNKTKVMVIDFVRKPTEKIKKIIEIIVNKTECTIRTKRKRKCVVYEKMWSYQRQ